MLHAILLVLIALATMAWFRRRATLRPPPSVAAEPAVSADAVRMTIVFATQRGTARTLAHKLFSRLAAWRRADEAHAAFLAPPRVLNAAVFDVDDIQKQDIVIYIAATYTDGVAPDDARNFSMLLQDMSNDWRFPRNHLAGTRYTVFGLGDVSYAANFNKFGKDIVHWMQSLGGASLAPPVFATERKMNALFNKWSASVLAALDKQFARAASGGGEEEEKESECGCDKAASSSDDDDGAELDDLEDLGAGSGKELLYPRLRQNLTKQGYALIGSHSGVKLCRWTKAMLRGRGGCYKHTFYNISSFQCMEMTPSLACANKCVFCWRHHTNPVATEFKWNADSPEFLVDAAIAAHRNLIKPMKGVPDVLPDRYSEAMNIKHCALSLVGEPIMYPHISRYVELLHSKHISTFMVTNAQFPDRIRDLGPVTQLYLSIDAATKDTLREIDRPLFDDFWERMLASVQELSLKKQRTVFRFTLVQGSNTSQVQEYADLVGQGRPDFIEVKGVTFCGENNASDITMKSVPYHDEVVAFAQDLCGRLGNNFAVAAEHQHSCCVLIANKRFRRAADGVWLTWIDYAKFFELVEAGGRDFDALTYACETPRWATFGEAERGFDPIELRHPGKGKVAKAAARAMRCGASDDK
jgi:tRNA wybutosine-synthesizing protein 1